MATGMKVRALKYTHGKKLGDTWSNLATAVRM